nr:PREDICTED: probable G-protein coupled receptor 148 [Lepisosteus oculatus]
MDAEATFLSLLCTFGTWYNSSGSAEGSSKTSNTTNSSTGSLERFTVEWQHFMPPWQMSLLQICPILCFLAVLLVIPLILVKVFSNPRMRQETRYLLLANALLCDLMFISFYMLTTCFSAAGVLMSKEACASLLYFLGVFYGAGVLTTKAMVLDTSLAVLLPLRYLSLWPVSRTKKAILMMWLSSLLLPAASVGLFLWYQSSSPCMMQICSLPLLLVLTVNSSRPLRVSLLVALTCLLVCLLLVFCGYVILYYKTRHSGIWRGCFSRAKGTFLIHYLLLFLSCCPALVLVIELLLYTGNGIDLRTDLWVSLVICNILVVLPKTLCPYMYGLRYRDLSKAVLAFYRLKWPSPAVSPLT